MSKVKESVNFRKEIKVGKFTISLKKIAKFMKNVATRSLNLT